MKLDKHIVDMFTELTKPADDVKMEKTCYGTISVVDGTRYVQLDGSNLLIPAASTVKTSHGDRVTVLMRNHTVVVTGNLTAPSSSDGGSTSETVPEHLHTVSDITDFPESLPANGGTADTAKSVATATRKAVIWEDSEGGNIGLTSPDGTKYAEMDIYDNANFRMYFSNNGMLDVSPLAYNFSSKKFTMRGDINGTASNATNADKLDGHHASDFAMARNTPLAYILSGQSGDIRTLVWKLPLGGYAINTAELPNVTFPVTGEILLSWEPTTFTQSSGTMLYYGILIVRPMLATGDTYICSVYNKTSYTDWQKLNDGGNADTLDGKHASDFYPAQAICVNGADYNSLISSGIYEIIGGADYPTTNAPNGVDTNNNFYVQVYRRSSTYLTQIAISVRRDKTIYVRSLSNGTWNAWAKINDGGNADTLDGFHVSNNGTRGVVTTSSDYGVTEVGKYIDFHTAAGQDFDGRLVKEAHGFCFFNADNSKGTIYANLNGNANTLGTHPASDFVLKTDYDALVARVAALENGGTT